VIRKLSLVGAVLAIIGAAPVPALAHGTGEHGHSSELSAPRIKYTMWTLENGLRVIALPDESTSTVTTSLWYDIGSKLDPEGRSGFAHLFEHILSRKTENMPYNMIYSLTADIGGTRNASNWIDRTNYYEQVPAQYLERMLWTHRERMANVVVDDEVFETERGVVKEELRQRVLAPPYGRLIRFVIPENAYDVLPHRRPGIGSIEDLDNATLDDALSFYEAYYGPDTATLIVAGNFELAALRALVNQYFGDIPPRQNPVDLALGLSEPERTQPRSIAVTSPNVPLPVVGSIWKAPPILHPDAAALEVLEAILTRGDNNRLATALIRSGLAVDAAIAVSMFRDGGQIAAYAFVSDGEAVMPAQATLDAEIERLRSERVSEAELEEAVSEIVASTLRRRETARGRAFELGEALVSSGDPDFADRQLVNIARVTAEDVQRVAKLYLDPEKRTAFTYSSGEDDPTQYANPIALPEFRTLPPATITSRTVKPEEERMAPPGPGEVPVVEAPLVRSHTLDNGLEIVAAKTSEVPIASIAILAPGGSKTDPRDKAGLAQMAAALADKGVGNRSATEIAARFESLGASFSGGASSDGTTFALSAPLANLAEASALAAEIVTGATYPEEEFERERNRAIDGLQVSLKNPGELARYVARVVMYGDAPYGSQPDGTAQSLAGLSPDDLMEHRSAYWRPDSMQVVVSGGIEPEQAFALVEEMFGDWRVEGNPVELPADPAGEPNQVRTIVVDLPGAGQAAVLASVRAPARTGEDYFALELANSILGGGSSGRLFDEIRTKRSLSYGAYSSFADRADDSILTASAQTKNESADEVAKIILGEFEKLGSEPFSDELLERRRLYLEGRHSRSLETSSGFTAIVAGLLRQGLAPDQAYQYAQNLAAVDPDSALQAAKDYIDPDAATLIVVGDASLFLEDLKQLRGEVEVITADQLDISTPDLLKPEPPESWD
jgi:zinc protease